MLAAAAWAAAVPPGSASDAGFDWHGLGGCTLPVVGMPIDFGNVAQAIPADHHTRVTTIGAGGGRQAVLVFVFGRCPTNFLRTHDATVSRDDVTQVMVGVLYGSGTREDADKAQFYLLSSAIDWRPFVLAEERIGLPSYYVEGLRLDVSRDPLGVGSFVVDVPAGAATVSASGRLLAPNPIREFPLDAVHFFQGPLGLVRVHHDESWAVGNEAVATITAPAGSRVAGWMGATTREAIGIYYWDHEERHVHSYRVVGPTREQAPPSTRAAPTARTRCGAVRRRSGKRRVRCSMRLSVAAQVTVRVTRGGRLYASLRRALPAGRSTVILRPRRRLRAGTYRLAVTIRAPQGSNTTKTAFRVRRSTSPRRT